MVTRRSGNADRNAAICCLNGSKRSPHYRRRTPAGDLHDGRCQAGTALGAQADSDNDAQSLLRTVLLLTSPMAWLYWKDYLGLDPAAAEATAGWAIKALTRATPSSGPGTPGP